MTKIYLIRHAQSEANLCFIYGSDAPLSAEGIRQAKAAESEIKNIQPDIVLSGTKIRQIQTAEILFPTIYRHNTDPIFDEIRFGELENKPITPALNREITDNVLYLRDYYGGDDIWLRGNYAINRMIELCEIYPYPKIAIITSDTLIQAIICLLLYGKQNGYIWTTQSHIRNCDCVKVVVNDKVVDKEGNACPQIDRVYINGKNEMTVPAWRRDANENAFLLV